MNVLTHELFQNMSNFAQQGFDFLGRMVTNDEIKLYMKNVKAIQQWNDP